MELFQLSELFLLELGEKTLVGSARERGVCGPSFGDSRAVAGPSTDGCGRRRLSAACLRVCIGEEEEEREEGDGG